MNASGTSIVIAGLLLAPGIASGIPFDDDGNGRIDLADYVAFEACLTGPGATYDEPHCAVVDENGDARVDALDYAGFQRAFDGAEPSPLHQVELAGNSLPDYPYFEYVKAFNEDATIEVAIDPTRYPDIVGRTGDIYVAEAKSAGAWVADPSLVDVTPGGPRTETFGGTSIQENTFTVVDPYDLDSAVFVPTTNAFTGLGHGYDVVIDANRNGELDAGDYIDGLGGEAGLYVLHDTTQPGPLTVIESAPYDVDTIFGLPYGSTNEVVYYPTPILTLARLPLIVITHGGGHEYTWYDHIARHMASYGYIVMAHQNYLADGTTTRGHTDAFLELQDVIEGGAINGHIDSNRIIWIGHSVGGRGVIKAFDDILDGVYTPTHYTADSIVLISAMLPPEWADTAPRHANFHLWTASGDTDITGAPGTYAGQTFPLHERATKYRMSTVVQGTGHAWFHNGPEFPSWFEGPCSIGREKVHDIQRGLFLPLIKYYAEQNVPASDFFWRQYERFHPIGVDTSDPCVVVTHEYRNGADHGNFFIDDYQSEPLREISSSGGAVRFSVHNVMEGRLRDNNTDFTWTADDQFNGATQARADDSSRGAVFDWNGQDLYYEWEVVPDERDFTQYKYLSFRGAQGTQHPYTLAALGDLTISVTLVDDAGNSSSINTGAYGGGFEQPYQRRGGWHNEMEVIRIRITDFITNASGLDLHDVVAVRFDVGPSWGSNEGRLVVDELMLTKALPPRFVPLAVELPVGTPEYLSPTRPNTLDVVIHEGSDTLVTGSAQLHYRFDDGPFQITALQRVAGPIFKAVIPPPACEDVPEYYLSAEGAVTGVVYAPATAPAVTFQSAVGDVMLAFDDDFNADRGWTVESIDLADGQWERGVPAGDGSRGDPTRDADGSGQCFLTGNRPGNSDVDGGPTWLISPTIDMTGLADPMFRYARWWSNDDQDGDPFDVEISDDDGAHWVLIERVINIPPGWVRRDVPITDFVAEPTDQMKVRFSVMDNPNDSVDEAGIDAVKIFDVVCE